MGGVVFEGAFGWAVDFIRMVPTCMSVTLAEFGGITTTTTRN